MKNNKPTKKLKIGRWVLLILVLFFTFKLSGSGFEFDQKVIIKKGDTVTKFVNLLPGLSKLKAKIYLKTHSIDFSTLQEGTYIFSGSYNNGSFFQAILEGPSQKYARYTVLEGWSIYDIDHDLSQKGILQPGEFIGFISDQDIISKYKNRYEFLQKAGNINNLEGFLYPDTYHIDANKNFADQLVYLQLENFKKKVWDNLSPEFNGFKYSLYETLTLASILEKEERASDNKSTVAGIFIKRLENGMRLDADITLCYGLQKPYETCTPSVIVQNISDKNNPYNTRQIAGIPSQPISNPSMISIKSVLEYTPSNYLFYLHDNEGNIYYADTIEKHNQNKNLYLK